MAAKPNKPNPTDVLAALNVRWRGSTEVLARCWDCCLEEMLILFYPPFRANDEDEMLTLSITGIRAYAEDLAGIPEDTLRRGWRDVRRAHKVERWPTIQAILEACQDSEPRSAGSKSGVYHRADSREQDYQIRAYGEVHMAWVTPEDADYHREQARAKESGEIGVGKGLNPYGYKRPGYVAPGPETERKQFSRRAA